MKKNQKIKLEMKQFFTENVKRLNQTKKKKMLNKNNKFIIMF